jgi:hypothetical protein
MDDSIEVVGPETPEEDEEGADKHDPTWDPSQAATSSDSD